MIHRGIVAGARYPDIYDMTWGEVNDFILARSEARRDEMREQASLYFSSVMLMNRSFAAKKNDKPLTLMDSFPYLWSDQERAKAKTEAFRRKVEGQAARRKAEEEIKEIMQGLHNQ